MSSKDLIPVSIIIPVYNRQNVVLPAIESILNQTYTNFELIIVDDASTDSTRDIVETINDKRLKYIRLNRNVGAGAARNEGIINSKHQWVAFHDSDDIWVPTKLEKQVKLIQENIPTVIFTSFIRYKNRKREHIPDHRHINPVEDMHKQLLLGNFIATPTVLLHKECLMKVGGFNVTMPRLQDWELWIRLSIHYPFVWIEEPLVEAYYTESSISSDENKLLEAYRLIWKLHNKMFLNAGPLYTARFLFSYGHNLALYGNLKKGRKILASSINHQFYSLAQLVCFLLSFSGQRIYRFMYKVMR